MTTVAIVDACPVYGAGLKVLLGEQGFSVVGVENCWEQAASHEVDVFIIDYESIQTCDFESFGTQAGTPLLLTVNDVDSCPSHNLDRRIAGIIDRSASVADIVAAVRTIVSGGRIMSSSNNAVALATVDDQCAGAEVLSQREKQVLFQISQGRTHGQIARSLGISQHTVDTYVRRVRAKLGVGNKAELTRIALVSMFGLGQPAPGAAVR